MLNCSRDAGVLMFYYPHTHPNSAFPLCANNNSAFAELLHCAVQSGRAPLQRASCRFLLRRAVTLTAPRGTGRGIWSSSWWVGLEQASEPVWASPLAKSIVETISSQRSIFTQFYLLFDEIVCVLLCEHGLGKWKMPSLQIGRCSL